jgi:hypothetical protein
MHLFMYNNKLLTLINIRASELVYVVLELLDKILYIECKIVTYFRCN